MRYINIEEELQTIREYYQRERETAEYYEKLLLAIVKEYGKRGSLKVHEYYLDSIASDDFLIVKPNKKEKCVKLFVDNVPF
jgi:hypothetical protein